ncbi:MAG: KilA-N domain-containing protein [Fibromonadaceae bacterium]|jgi:hypothetical protein|nr:KilA-N domain-containing protein [Fibromonadaceae bacterium]
MGKKETISVQGTEITVQSSAANGNDYICITDIARHKNPLEPKDVVKNWMRSKSTLEFLGLWEKLHNPNFKGVDFDPLIREAGSNSFLLNVALFGKTAAQWRKDKPAKQRCYFANEVFTRKSKYEIA